MILLQSFAGTSKVESLVLFVLVCVAIYLYFRFPLITSGGMGFSVSDSGGESRVSSSRYGPNHVTCPYCGAKNDGSYLACHHCNSRLYP